MALILEEEKKSFNWSFIIVAILIILFLVFAAYYIFFLKPELVDVVIKKDNVLSDLSKIQIQPDDIINSDFYKNLKVYLEEDSLEETPGRLNPFEPF